MIKWYFSETLMLKLGFGLIGLMDYDLQDAYDWLMLN